MKTMLIVSSLIAAGFAFEAAEAANDAPDRDRLAALAADPNLAASAFHFDPGRPECGPDRLSVIWGPDRQPGAYVCYGPVGGS